MLVERVKPAICILILLASGQHTEYSYLALRLFATAIWYINCWHFLFQVLLEIYSKTKLLKELAQTPRDCH